jgi:hypothetical protein
LAGVGVHTDLVASAVGRTTDTGSDAADACAIVVTVTSAAHSTTNLRLISGPLPDIACLWP